MEAAQALFTPGPTEAEAAAFGLTVEEASGPPVEVWPDNMGSVDVFIDLMTQWRRVGMTGAATGLDYTALPAVFAIRGIPKKRQSPIFDDIQVMEAAALEVLNKK